MEEGYCNKCSGMKKLVFGLLLLMNAFWWPLWTGVDGWAAFLGAVFVLTGLLCVVKPNCGCSTKKKR